MMLVRIYKSIANYRPENPRAEEVSAPVDAIAAMLSKASFAAPTSTSIKATKAEKAISRLLSSA